MVKEGDTAAALAVSGNKIVYVGEDSGVDEYIDDNTRVIDLDGGMVTPGFMDGHIHAPGNWVTALYEIDLTKSTTIDEYKKVISDFVTKHPDDEAYVGGSFMINAFEQEDGTNPGPNKSILDEICSDKPIMLTMFPIIRCGSTAVRSSLRASITIPPIPRAASSPAMQTARRLAT